MDPLEQLHGAICLAFNTSDLAMLVRFRLGEKLRNITNEHAPFNTIVFELIDWAEARGRLGELVQNITRERPLNKDIVSAAMQLGFGSAPPPEPYFEAPPDSRPPQPSPVLDSTDPQKGRWGGKPEREGRRLFANLGEILDTYFYLDFVVESTDGSILEGPVVFHLHDTYPKSAIWIQKIRDKKTAILEEVTSYGVYTIGAQVKNAAGNWVGLEFDISKLRGLPSSFRRN